MTNYLFSLIVVLSISACLLVFVVALWGPLFRAKGFNLSGRAIVACRITIILDFTWSIVRLYWGL